MKFSLKDTCFGFGSMKFSMKNVCVGVLLTSSIGAFAALDSDNYPIVYLRGSMSEWQIDSKYKFDRDGNTYTLQITEENSIPEGTFKIGDEDWHFDFGAPEPEFYIDSSCRITLLPIGPNIYTHGISEGSITFQYPSAPDWNMKATFIVAGTEFPEPEPIPDPSASLSGTLPVMYINVFTDEYHSGLENEVIDYELAHKNYFNYAEYWVDLNGCKWMEELGAKSVGSKEEPLPLQIKARGNWTRIGFSKKPFKLKLDKKQDLLGLTPEKSKHYALLAHADDTDGYMRNFTNFNLGERIGLPWTPKMQPVELVINGDYRGLYFLTESIRVQEGRIEIEELDDNVSDPEIVSGGYVVELDNYNEENQIRMDELSWVDGQFLDILRITWDTPEIYSDLQIRFITDQFTAMNEAIGSNSDNAWSYLDIDDAARYYLVNEITGDTESYHGSTYLFRDRGDGQKWHFSPLWDAGNTFRGREGMFFYDCDPFGNTWIPSMRENYKFNNKVKETWLWFMQNCYDGLENDLEEFAAHIKKACEYDYNRWSNEYVPAGGQEVADNRDIDSRLNEVKAYLRNRTEWLKGEFGNYLAGNFPEPSRDNTPAAALPDYAKGNSGNGGNDDAGIQSVKSGDGDIIYFNLQGRRIENPKSGEIYIIKQGGATKKILVP